MRLASERDLAVAAARFDGMRSRLGGYRSGMIDHPVAGWCLRNYLILTECPDLLADLGLSEVELFWSRYFWLARFARVWFALVGYDAGLEQQVDEFVDDFVPGGLDRWPEIRAAAERAAKEQLYPAD